MPVQSLHARWSRMKRRKLQGEGTSAEGGSCAAHPAAHMTATNFLPLDDFEVIPSPAAPVNPSITPTEKLSVDAPTTGSDSAPLHIIPESIAEPFVPISLAMASPVNVPHPDEPIYPGSSAEPSSSRTEEPLAPSQLHFVQGSPLAPFLPEPQYRTNPADMAEFRKMPFSAQFGHLRNSFYSFVAQGQYLFETTDERIEEHKAIMEKLQGAFGECQARLAEAQREKEELTRSVNELEQHKAIIKKLHSDKKSLQESLQRVSELQEKKQGAFEECQARLAEAQREKEELTRSVNELEQHKAIIKKLHSDKKSLQESLQRVFELQEKKQGAFEECQARLAEAQREKEELTQSVNELQQEKKELAATVEWLTQELAAQKELEAEFGDDSFFVGIWEAKEILSRDGQMKLQAQVLFASFDQKSERAAGEGACIALAAVIANWLHSNQSKVPIKSEFDSLIRGGSLEWRNLCENEVYKQRFRDEHFELDTILEAGIRPLSIDHLKSFTGFFRPEGLEGYNFDVMVDCMSFDGIWDKISRNATDCPNGESLVYIVSWNDHFFVLKVEQDAYYIIDTLGERLYEGCNQAYILKFDRDTTIKRLPKETKAASNEKMEGEIVCKGKESCKEYVKSFLAAIPISDLPGDFKKGPIPLHLVLQRLQIEFLHTQPTQSEVESS